MREHRHEPSRGRSGLEEARPPARERLLGRNWGESCREEKIKDGYDVGAEVKFRR